MCCALFLLVASLIFFFSQGAEPSLASEPSFEPDYDPDDKDDKDDKNEPREPAPQPLKPDESEEVMARVLKLLEEQRLHSQAFLAKTTDASSAAQLQEDCFRSLMSATPLAVLPFLDKVTPNSVLQMKDVNGFTLLHTAARIGCWEAMDRLLAICPVLCDQLSSPNGRPAHWTPLMVLIDTGSAARDKQEFYYMLQQLLEHSSLATIECKSGNGSSALHMATSKGMFHTTKKILWAVYNKGTGDQTAFGLVSSMLNQTNSRGAGCVTWLSVYCDIINIIYIILY